MVRRITIPRLGLARTDHALVERVLRLRAEGITDSYTVTEGGKPYHVTRRSDRDLYARMMAAKGRRVQLGEAPIG